MGESVPGTHRHIRKGPDYGKPPKVRLRNNVEQYSRFSGMDGTVKQKESKWIVLKFRMSKIL